MPPPLIGLTIMRQTETSGLIYQRVAELYIEALLRAGAIPMLIPLGLSQAGLDELVKRLDGILFSGGGDIHPDRYGSISHPLLSGVDSDRDWLEIELVKTAIERQLPFLGICRGLQVINVATGGSLYEDLADQYPNALQHDCFKGYPRDYLAHPVQVETGTKIAQIMGVESIWVNSLHHQGVRELAPGLIPSAYSSDSLVEALEVYQHPFGVAVQWHPECLPGNVKMQALFEAFVQAAESNPLW